jgi:osmotically inducible lipoprotein OsmB
MNTIQKTAATVTLTIMLLAMNGCTLIGIGVGAVAGTGTAVGTLGGAVIGGVIGHEIGD